MLVTALLVIVVYCNFVCFVCTLDKTSLFIADVTFLNLNLNRSYEHPNPGYGATFLTPLEQKAVIATSLCRQFYTFAQLLANLQFPDSPTVKNH